MDASLVDRYCAEPHSSPITAAAYDAESGARVTADAWGTVAITRPGDTYPSIIFDMGHPVTGAVAVCAGGALVAVGDEQGTVAVFKTQDGSCVFEDMREGEDGASRAMRALSFNPQGNILATLSIDGIVRIFDLQTWARVANYKGYGGDTLSFDRFGERLLAIDTLGQPKLLDLTTSEIIGLELVPGGVRLARFASDEQHVLVVGTGGLTLLALPDGNIVDTFSSKGSSGMVTMVLNPKGDQLAVVTGRSVHTFSVPQLEHMQSDRHGVEAPNGAGYWDEQGLWLAGEAGGFSRTGARPSLGEVICAAGIGEHRVACHRSHIAVWRNHRQRRPFSTLANYIEVRIDRDGRLVLALGDEDQGVHVFDTRTGKLLFAAGQDTANTPRMEVGGSIVAIQLPKGGMRWYDLGANNVFELDWPTTFSLSGSGTWLAVVTPDGGVQVLDPKTGEQAIPAPTPLADTKVVQVCLVNRTPHLLVLDEDGVLGRYDLTDAVNENRSVEGADILDFNVTVDRMWGLSGGRHAVLRFQDEETQTASVVFVDLENKEVAQEVPSLLPYVWVDTDNEVLIQPGRGGAIVDVDRSGEDQRVLRALPDGQWIAFGNKGVLDTSDDAAV